MSDSESKKFVIIDGKSVFYRGYYAMPNLATKTGTPTGGVFGFATMALEVIKRLHPDYVAVAWDKPKTNIRRRLEMYPEYKAGRKPAPPDFYEQIPLLHELLDAFGWPLYELDDYEADDIMGTLAVQAREKGIETLLVTSDMDMLQLINGNVHVYALKTGLSNIELYSPKSFEAKYGIEVSQFLDLKALKGDSSDNIPGVPGIGEKGALELLKAYKTLDGVYDNLALVKDSLRKKLEAGKDSAYLSRELARIWTDAPITLDLNEVDGSKADPNQIATLLREFEFRNLAARLPDIMKVSKEAITSPTAAYAPPEGKMTIITSEAGLRELGLDSKSPVFIYSRAGGAQGANPQRLLVSTNPKEVYSLDLTSIPKTAVKDFIGSLEAIIGYDLKTSYKLFLHYGLKDLPAVHHDVQIGAFLLNCLRREQSLSELARSDLGYEGSGFEELDLSDIDQRGVELMGVIRNLYEMQQQDLKKQPKLHELADKIEWPVIAVLARMEYRGIRLDTDYLVRFADRINDLISDYEQQIYGYADQEFNISSPAQLAEILFVTLGLPTKTIKKGKTGYSTAASELEKLRGSHPIIDLITQYREVTKLKNTYVDTLPTQVDTESRIHTTYNLTIAQTGRLSSTDPNLQNIPTRTELGRNIRTAFVADKGTTLISADYSQFELRLAAVLADDKELIELFNSGADIHTATAAQVYDRQPDEVTKQMRRAAKVINFGILYGMSPHGLSVATGMSREQAADFIDKYKAHRKPLFDYMESVKLQAAQDGYVETLFGRRRPMPDIHSTNFVVRQAAERAAINMPIQGTEADLMKLAMNNVDTELRTHYPESVLLLQVHDSIVVEAPAASAQKIAAVLKKIMEDVYPLKVRLDVDVSLGKNWGEL